jgi:hypothetical protein
MHIYIDESGNFLLPKGKKFKTSCVAALVLPSSKKDEIFNGFQKICSSWGHQPNIEIKGRRLNESQIAETISYLNKFDILVEICGIDLGMHNEKQISEFKKIQADKLTENLTSDHHPHLVDQVHKLKTFMLGLSNQLFVQYVITTELIARLVEIATMYYCQRIPSELGVFHWMVDAKDKKVKTPFEDMWTKLILPFTSSRSVKQPLALLEGGDYSHFKRFFLKADQASSYLKQDDDQNEVVYLSGEIMNEYFAFRSSDTEPGLQLVDIVASAFSRALNGTLAKKGWENLGSLIVRKKEQSVQMISLNTNLHTASKRIVRSPQGTIMEEISMKAKPMILG